MIGQLQEAPSKPDLFEEKRQVMLTRLEQASDAYGRNSLIHFSIAGISAAGAATSMAFKPRFCGPELEEPHFCALGEVFYSIFWLGLAGQGLILGVSHGLNSVARKQAVIRLRKETLTSTRLQDLGAVQRQLDDLASASKKMRLVGGGILLSVASAPAIYQAVKGRSAPATALGILLLPSIAYGLFDILSTSQMEDLHDDLKAKISPYLMPTSEGGLSGGIQILF